MDSRRRDVAVAPSDQQFVARQVAGRSRHSPWLAHGPSGGMAWNESWNESPENCVRPVLSVHTSAASVQAGRSGRRSGPLLIRGFGVQVPGGAPVFIAPDLVFLGNLVILRLAVLVDVCSMSARMR